MALSALCADSQSSAERIALSRYCWQFRRGKIPSIDDAEKFAQWLLEDFDLNGETVMLAPAAGFYSTPNKGKNQVRIAYVLNMESLQKAIACLDVALKDYHGRTI